jgi:insertion element IS1 protein InsB
LPQAGADRARGRGRARRGLALRRKKARKLWIWKALERGGTGRLIDWECGDRDQATLERLLGRLEPWGVRLFCTDDYAPYDAALPAGRHYVGKDQTQRSESNNARQRHWFARFRRRTCVVSRSVEMVEATMALFAFYHCNGGQLTPALVG